MTNFRKGLDFHEQAKKIVIKAHTYGQTHGSVRSIDHSIMNLTRTASWAHEHFNIKYIDQLNDKMIYLYLNDRAAEVAQKTLNQERNSLMLLTQRETSKLYNLKIEVALSEVKSILSCRSYTREQINLIKLQQSSKHALATEISYVAGLRAHELATIRRIHEQPIDMREWSPNKHLGREQFISYTVVGKGGLTRDIRLPHYLSEELEAFRVNFTIKIKDRNVNYLSYYDIGYGNNWSASFTRASQRALGFSRGAHGCRHSYAQIRMQELQAKNLSYEEALAAVSHELGHLRPSITLVYLR